MIDQNLTVGSQFTSEIQRKEVVFLYNQSWSLKFDYK